MNSVRASAAVSPLRSVRAPPISDQPPPRPACEYTGMPAIASASRSRRAVLIGDLQLVGQLGGGDATLGLEHEEGGHEAIGTHGAQSRARSGHQMTTSPAHDGCMNTSPTSRAAAIEASGLRKRFGDVTALDGLDLVAPAGAVTAVLGPNGAGKTTFVRTVATLAVADEGSLDRRRHRRRRPPGRGAPGHRARRPARRRRAGADRAGRTW